jgi:hypothetical protein
MEQAIELTNQSPRGQRSERLIDCALKTNIQESSALMMKLPEELIYSLACKINEDFI